MLKTSVKYRGFFRAVTTNSLGEVTGDTGIFPNLITDGGLDFIGACPGAGIAYGIQDFTAMVAVGTGNTPPTTADTTLQSWVAAVYSNSGNGCSDGKIYVAGPPAYWQGQRSWQFPAGSGSGNIAELGVGPNSSQPPVATNPLFSRALIVDGGGSPTVLPWLITEALTVTYILRQYLDLTDTNYSMSLSGTPYSGIFRRASVGTVPSLGIVACGNIVNANNICILYNGTLGAVTSSPSGASTAANAYIGDPGYTIGTHFKTLTYSFGINTGNLAGGISAFLWSYSGIGAWQSSVAPVIPKTNAYNMSLVSSVSWARYP